MGFSYKHFPFLRKCPRIQTTVTSELHYRPGNDFNLPTLASTLDASLAWDSLPTQTFRDCILMFCKNLNCLLITQAVFPFPSHFTKHAVSVETKLLYSLNGGVGVRDLQCHLNIGMTCLAESKMRVERGRSAGISKVCSIFNV